MGWAPLHPPPAPLLTVVWLALLPMPVLRPEMSYRHFWEKSGLSPHFLAMSSGRPSLLLTLPAVEWAMMLTV